MRCGSIGSLIILCLTIQSLSAVTVPVAPPKAGSICPLDPPEQALGQGKMLDIIANLATLLNVSPPQDPNTKLGKLVTDTGFVPPCGRGLPNLTTCKECAKICSDELGPLIETFRAKVDSCRFTEFGAACQAAGGNVQAGEKCIVRSSSQCQQQSELFNIRCGLGALLAEYQRILASRPLDFLSCGWPGILSIDLPVLSIQCVQ